MESICLKAMAKINLGLDVVRRREDGYHEVRMIMQTVDLYDQLIFTKEAEPGIRITADRPEIPTGERNLVYKAAKLLMDQYGIRGGIRVQLEKRIPMAAGMAGGSTDAAAAMIAVNRLFELGLSRENLMELGVRIGADVPYCILGGTALAEGIGEKLTKLPDAPECTVLIAKPDIHVSTKFVYENLHANTLTNHPDIDGMVTAIREGRLAGVTERLGNVLETVTVRKHPVIADIKTGMLEQGAEGALMSGSGPTVFGIFRERKQAETAFARLKEQKLAKELLVTGLINQTCAE